VPPLDASAEKVAPFQLGEGSDAVLLLHGFTGTPWDVRPLGDALAAKGYHVRAPLLPGHGLDPEAMTLVTWRDWEAAAESEFAALSGRRRVCVAGLSMGGLLALLLAERHPERVRALALLAPAVRFRGLTMKVLRASRRMPWVEWVRPWVNKTATDLSDPAGLHDAPMIPRFPSARLADLWRVQDHADAALSSVRAHVLICVAEHDHVVDPHAAAALSTRLSSAASVRVVELRRGFHILPRDVDGPRVAEEVGGFFDALR